MLWSMGSQRVGTPECGQGSSRQGQGHSDTITKVGGRVPPSCPQYTGGPHTQVFKENDGLSLFCRIA